MKTKLVGMSRVLVEVGENTKSVVERCNMKFNNKPNKMIEHKGQVYWISRSIAVVGLVFARCKGETYVLINKRGQGVPDYKGYWNLPCGYLDWNESAAEAIVREVYEETGLNLRYYFTDGILDTHQPFYVASDVNQNKQNVSLRYMFYFRVDELPKLTDKHNEEDETDEIGWFKLDEIEDKNFAFGHKEIIKKWSVTASQLCCTVP